jgi:hypothetical protein
MIGGWALGNGLYFTRDQAHQMGGELGRAVQDDPMKPTLKPPGTQRLRLGYAEPLSNFAFKFNLRRYSWSRW